ncbi:microtubule-associated protein 9 isoform X2 [Betta splendens]|uniref:Microtubule-associated protein 9 isoform X2 n=1 Tax=Betta splendens TaxID=158456 RepID=A0A9W2XZ83_BETSP|nr:microtubule-associated protein 9 isoform X2 [Betta splendens]
MTSSDFRTLAYAKSPKTSKRTTFQDELQAAVSARAGKTKTGHNSYSDELNEDEDEFLKELLKSRKKRTEAFKAGRSKGTINDFDISDDASTPGRTKKVSFLKSQRTRSPSEDTTTPESHGNDPLDNSFSRNNSYKNSASEKTTLLNSADSQITEDSASKSVSRQTSDGTLTDMPLPLPSDSSLTETPGPELSHPSAAETKHLSSVDLDDLEKEPPRPKPRQRTFGLHAPETLAEESEFQDYSKPQTSPASIPHLTDDTSSSITCAEEEYADSYSLNKSSTSKSEQSQVFTNSTVDSGSRDDCISDESREKVARYSTSFEEFNDNNSENSAVRQKSFDIRSSSCQSKTSQRSQSVFSRDVESKYLGSLKILDCNLSLQDSQLQTVQSLRAAVYQEWLKKKNEIVKENRQQKKKEEMLKEKKKRDQEAKKEDAIASYAAWKEKKTETLKAKAKEKEVIIRKEQKAIEEKEEKKQSAKQVFEKWKHEHDQLLKDKYRKQKESENRRKLKTQETEEERKRESKYAFSDWCDKKKDVIHKKITMERKEIKNKTEEERYMKEERDKMALDMYENWLVRKDLEKKREKEERRIHEILQDSPPPPWSPPNKTIPHGK